jgi:hypothetical protein
MTWQQLYPASHEWFQEYDSNRSKAKFYERTEKGEFPKDGNSHKKQLDHQC